MVEKAISDAFNLNNLPYHFRYKWSKIIEWLKIDQLLIKDLLVIFDFVIFLKELIRMTNKNSSYHSQSRGVRDSPAENIHSVICCFFLVSQLPFGYKKISGNFRDLRVTLGQCRLVRLMFRSSQFSVVVDFWGPSGHFTHWHAWCFSAMFQWKFT